MPPPSRGGARGGRGAAAPSKLKFQPKSNVRRSQAERERDEKKEQAAIRAEEAAVERERKRQEERAARRGGGAMRARGGARGGMSGWMAGGVEPDTGHLSGAVASSRYSGSRSGGGGGGGGGGSSGGRHAGEAVSAGGSGGGASGGGRRQDDGFKSEVGASWRDEGHYQRADGSRMRMVNIEDIHTINISSDEGEGAEDKPKDKTKTRPVRRGLAPVRVARHEHIPRKTKVNIDLTAIPAEDREKAKDMASTNTQTSSAADKPIKIEDDEEESAPKIKQEGSPKAKRRPARRQKKPETVVLDEESEEEEGERAHQATKQKPSLPADAQPLANLMSVPAVSRPMYVRDDCNFVALPRPPGWSSKEDAEEWDRNIRRMYAVYEELSFPEKTKKGTAIPSDTTDPDVKMQDAETTDKGKSKEGTTGESRSDRKQDLVYMFRLPPRWPGIEDMVSKEEYEKAQKKAARDADGTHEAGENGNNDDDLITVDPPASPKIKRSRSPETPRKGKGKGKGAESKIKQEGTGELVAIKSEPSDDKDAANATSASSAPGAGDGKKARLPGSGKPGYIGDLVVYSTGEARLDWGGLHLTLEMGRQTSMLQQVLLTDVPVVHAGARAADPNAPQKRGRGRPADADAAKVKKEPGVAAGASASRALRVDDDDGDDEAAGNDDGGDAEGGAADGAPVAPMSAAARELESAYAMGSVAGSFTAIPDFSAILGRK